MYIVVGLGNPKVEYARTRHNTGRMLTEYLSENFPADTGKVKFVVLDSYMNQSGGAVAKIIKSKKTAERLIVIYDDLDLPLGMLKISYNRGSGGHRGLDSIIHTLKTKEFIRIRVGITPTTPNGKLKKPKTEASVEKFILGEFKKPEMEIIKKMRKKIGEAIATIANGGLNKAMSVFN